jgi:hypothetical protein
MAQHTKGESSLIVPSGRKALLTEEMLKAVYTEITRRSMDYNSIRTGAGGEYTLAKLVFQEMQKHQTNPLARRLREVDAHTKKKWVMQLGVVVRAAQKKPRSRQGSLDMRNPMSYAAGLRYLFREAKVSFELVVTSDDVSIMIHPMVDKEVVKVITTKEAIAWLEKHNKVCDLYSQLLYHHFFLLHQCSFLMSLHVL